LEDLAVFETSPYFDRREKAALRYAEQMTRVPAEISDAVFEEIQTVFSTEQIVELTGSAADNNIQAGSDSRILARC